MVQYKLIFLDKSSKVPSVDDVWVLAIKNVKLADSGIYVCEVNSSPIVRSFHKLSGKYITFFASFLIRFDSALESWIDVIFLLNDSYLPFW